MHRLKKRLSFCSPYSECRFFCIPHSLNSFIAQPRVTENPSRWQKQEDKASGGIWHNPSPCLSLSLSKVISAETREMQNMKTHPDSPRGGHHPSPPPPPSAAPPTSPQTQHLSKHQLFTSEPTPLRSPHQPC